MSKKNETKSLKQHVVKRNKIKVIHGPFVEEPKCIICNADIPHEWLGGDYSLLLCDKKECLDELNKRYERP